MKQLELFGPVSVGVDGELHAFVYRHPSVDISQVEPSRIGVYFQYGSCGGRSRYHGIHVQIGPDAIREQPAGWMADYINVGIVNGIQ